MLQQAHKTEARWWHACEDGTVQCDLCPRECRLHDGQHGACVIRVREGSQLRLKAYGLSSGFCIDPVEKKPLNHFFPGSRILSFGTAGCNLACRFCQNWDISAARHTAELLKAAPPAEIAGKTHQLGVPAVAFTYNDPVIFAEYAIDVAHACHSIGIRTVAVSAGYIQPGPRAEFFSVIDAANVDLKGFSDSFYRKMCAGKLAPVLDTLEWIRNESNCWLEITTLLIPGANDSAGEVRAMCQWIVRTLGPDTPMHFTAFHPAHRLLDKPATPLASLKQAKNIAQDEGLRYVYLGNIRSAEDQDTECPNCHARLIVREGYAIVHNHLAAGRCPHCGTTIAGRFD